MGWTIFAEEKVGDEVWQGVCYSNVTSAVVTATRTKFLCCKTDTEIKCIYVHYPNQIYIRQNGLEFSQLQ